MSMHASVPQTVSGTGVRRGKESSHGTDSPLMVFLVRVRVDYICQINSANPSACHWCIPARPDHLCRCFRNYSTLIPKGQLLSRIFTSCWATSSLVRCFSSSALLYRFSSSTWLRCFSSSSFLQTACYLVYNANALDPSLSLTALLDHTPLPVARSERSESIPCSCYCNENSRRIAA